METKLTFSSAAGILSHRRLFLAIAFAVGTWFLGFRFLHVVGTDRHSETQSVAEAVEMLKGNHSVGIVSYTHYPNGPTYIIYLFLKLGIFDLTLLRLIPLTISALAVGFLFWRTFEWAQTEFMKMWIVAAFVFF